MKKICLILLAVLTGVSLCACEYNMDQKESQTASNKEAVGDNANNELLMQAPDMTPSTTLTPIPQIHTAKTPEQVTDESAVKQLKEILSDISENYHDGTAGCSLEAAIYAAKLLDFEAENPTTDKKAVMQEFLKTLNEKQLDEFTAQIDAIYFAAGQLLTDTAKDLMDSAGITPKHAPWTKEQVSDLFTSLYEGMDKVTPDERNKEKLETKLTDILNDISLNYHNSTAGCSLKAAAFAGELLDWWEESLQTSVLAVDVKEVTKEFYEKLSTDQALEISEQMDAIYFAAQRVTGDGGAELLDTAGYVARFAPWEKQEVTDLFTEIYAGISSKMPEENE